VRTGQRSCFHLPECLPGSPPIRTAQAPQPPEALVFSLTPSTVASACTRMTSSIVRGQHSCNCKSFGSPGFSASSGFAANAAASASNCAIALACQLFAGLSQGAGLRTCSKLDCKALCRFPRQASPYRHNPYRRYDAPDDIQPGH